MTPSSWRPRLAQLDRRTFLRGIGGLALALPLLEVMRPARASVPVVPARYLLGFGGFSLSTDGATESSTLVPTGQGAGYALHPSAASLVDLSEEITWVSGLEIPRASPGGAIPPGGRLREEDSFHFHNNPMLAGMRQVGDFKDSTVTGQSTDQVMADLVGQETLFRSLHLCVQANDYVNDADPRANVLSYRISGDGVAPVRAYTSPRQVFDTLTSGFLPADEAEAASRIAELERRRSVLDLVDRRIGGLVDRLGAADRARLERHWDEIRELERRLGTPLASAGGMCQSPTGWYDDPVVDPAGWSTEDERGRRFAELIRFAFSCDLTRVITLQYTYFGSMISGEALGGDRKPAHVTIHEGPMYNIEAIASWHMEQLGGLLRSLRDTPEGEGSLLDATALGYLIEGGYALSDFNPGVTTSHTSAEMLMLTAGRAGGLRPGRHVRASEGFKHPVQVMLGLMNAAGATVQQHGEVSGPSPDL